MKPIRIAIFAVVISCTLFGPGPAAPAAWANGRALYSFCSVKNCNDGAYPEAGVIALNGTLYGTTSGGGRGAGCSNPGCGTVFSLDPGTGVETVLHAFCRQLGCADGTDPFDAGVIDMKGTLYGTAFQGGGGGCGGNGCGTVFSLDPVTGALKVLYSFAGNDGAFPQGAMIDVKGMLYGVTQGGGKGGMGTVFVLDTRKGTEKVLYSFCTQQNCTDGFNPNGVIDVNGTLYGTTLQGGSYNCGQGQGCGTAVAIDLRTGAETVLHSFGNGSDGWYPRGGLIAVGGMLYGTTAGGGIAGCGGTGCGTLFSIDPGTGAETVLYSFCGQQNCADGAHPLSGLIDVKGLLYGTTGSGGAHGLGTVVSSDPNTGAETVLYSFAGTDGANPSARLIYAKGTLYGTTDSGGAHGKGTVFQLRK